MNKQEGERNIKAKKTDLALILKKKTVIDDGAAAEDAAHATGTLKNEVDEKLLKEICDLTS